MNSCGQFIQKDSEYGVLHLTLLVFGFYQLSSFPRRAQFFRKWISVLSQISLYIWEWKHPAMLNFWSLLKHLAWIIFVQLALSVTVYGCHTCFTVIKSQVWDSFSRPVMVLPFLKICVTAFLLVEGGHKSYWRNIIKGPYQIFFVIFHLISYGTK